jgi:uncharacterized protein involved in exopolysaccharide biosynthesis
MHALVDDFSGNPDEFYTLVAEEVKRRGLEGVTFDWGEEAESTKMLRSGQKARTLRVMYRSVRFNVLALQVGRSFMISVRKTFEHEPGKAGFLHEALAAAFEETIHRSTRGALKRYLEAKGGKIPPSLTPEEVFI